MPMDGVKHTIDGGALLAAVGAAMHWMPDLAALLSVVWYVIRLAEWAKAKREEKDSGPAG